MALADEITLEGEHGQYRTRVGGPEYRLTTVTEGLMTLAELDGFATN